MPRPSVPSTRSPSLLRSFVPLDSKPASASSPARMVRDASSSSARKTSSLNSLAHCAACTPMVSSTPCATSGTDPSRRRRRDRAPRLERRPPRGSYGRAHCRPARRGSVRDGCVSVRRVSRRTVTTWRSSRRCCPRAVRSPPHRDRRARRRHGARRGRSACTTPDAATPRCAGPRDRSTTVSRRTDHDRWQVAHGAQAQTRPRDHAPLTDDERDQPGTPATRR